QRLYGLSGPAKLPHVPQEMPFKATRRHQYWTVDLRHIDHPLDDKNVYRFQKLERAAPGGTPQLHYLRSGLKPARSSSTKSSGSSQAAKWPPLSTSLKYVRLG